MEQQSAVEFLISQISKDTLGKSFIATWKQEFEQAKQIEKEQIVEAFSKNINPNTLYARLKGRLPNNTTFVKL